VLWPGGSPAPDRIRETPATGPPAPEQVGEAPATGPPPDAVPVAGQVLPVPTHAGPAAALVLFGARDAELARAVATRVGAALSTAHLQRAQLELTATLQQSLTPMPPEVSPGMGWGTAYRPARSAARSGGDFLGTHRLVGGGVLFFLGDVSGTGVPAAVLSGQVRQGLRVLSRIERDPLRILRLLNDMLIDDLPIDPAAGRAGRFVTVVLGTAEPGPDGLFLSLAGGGHLPPLVLRADGSVQPVTLGGMLLGVDAEPAFGTRTVRLAPGESCVMVTDGVIEARGGHRAERLGLPRLITGLTGCAVMPPSALAERVEQLAAVWAGDQPELAGHDTMAVLAVRAEDTGPRPPRRQRRAVNTMSTWVFPERADEERHR
jgi:serine phosphatase RsbU (regulator of sigma subunit)